MTVIAWDGRTLAADKRAVHGGGIVRTTTKIFRLREGALGAVTGAWDIALRMKEWYEAGAAPDDFPKSAESGDASLIVIRPDPLILVFATGPYALPIESPRAAFGSGRDFAEATMHLGYGAARAVQVACAFQSDCGGGIDTLEFLE